MENTVEVGLRGVSEGTMVWFLQGRASRKGEIESCGVAFGEELFRGWMVEKETVGDRAAANTDALEGVGVKFRKGGTGDVGNGEHRDEGAEV